MGAQILESLLSVILQRYPGVELLDQMAVLCLIFWETAIPFSTVTVLFYIPTNNVQGFQFIHILADSTPFLFYIFIVAILVCVWGGVWFAFL